MLLEKGFHECVYAVKEVKSVTDVKKILCKVHVYMDYSFYMYLKI